MVAEKVFAVIAETTRRDILVALAQESKAVGQLVDELGVSQPTVSKHLRVLREAGVVTMRAQGQKRFYGINTEPLALVTTWLESLGAGTGALAGQEPVRTVAVQQPVKGKHSAGLAPAVITGTGTNGTSAVAAVPAAPTAGPNGSDSTKESAPAELEVLPAESGGSETIPATVVPFITVPRPPADLVVQSHDHDGGVQGQISRSVGRAANKAADLLANLPALPTFRRKKD